MTPKERSINAALAKADSLRYEFGVFMRGVAQWFEEHPDLAKTSPRTIHSVKARLKDTDHLREKIERKWTPSDPIDSANIFDRITDIAGVRIIHLYQAQFPILHGCVMKKVNDLHDWVLYEPPRAYTWDPESEEFFSSLGLQCDLKDSFYTSVHYVVRPREDSPITCEIQVRTLFEEIWGEVDHAFNYPVAAEVESCREQLKVLAKLVGAGSRLVDSIFKSTRLNPSLDAADSRKSGSQSKRTRKR
jgi:putative GTP pyrophosphokinase